MDQCLPYQLPNKILQDKFTALLLQSDLAAIRQASKPLYHLSTRVLYRRTTLVKQSQLVKCSKTLVGSNFHAEMVHEFVIDIPRSAYVSRIDLLLSMIRLQVLKSTLKCLCFLRVLVCKYLMSRTGLEKAAIDVNLTFTFLRILRLGHT